MAKSSKKADVIPVTKDKKASRMNAANQLITFEEMERWIEDVFSRNWLRQHRMEWPSVHSLAGTFKADMPKVDIIDRDNELFIKAELPGIDKKDIDVTMTDNSITIKASSKKEEKEERGEYYRCETTQGSFSRTLSLPAEVNIDKSSADFKDGVLELRLPKMEHSKRRSIKVG